MPPSHLAGNHASVTEELTARCRGRRVMHDFNLTAGHVVFMDLPVVFDLDLAKSGSMPYRWDDEYGARLGVLLRYDLRTGGVARHEFGEGRFPAETSFAPADDEPGGAGRLPARVPYGFHGNWLAVL